MSLVETPGSWHQAQFQTGTLDSGWIQGVCVCAGDTLSYTWPVRGVDQPRTTPMPFQRISTGLCGSPDHPRRAETAERATWSTKTPPRPPTAGTPPALAHVRRKPRRWDPLVPIPSGVGVGVGGGAPRWQCPSRRAPRTESQNCWQYPTKAPHSTR
jgi:hypothetical protein